MKFKSLSSLITIISLEVEGIIIMAPLIMIALLIIPIFSPVIQASPTTNPDVLTSVEKEIILVHQHIIPGLTAAAKDLVSPQ